MTSQYDQDRQQAANERQAAENMDRLRLWLANNHPGLTGIASQKVFITYFGDRLFTPLNEDDFAFALQKTRTKNTPGYVPTEAEQKSELIEEICDLLKSKDGTGRDGKYSNFDLKTVRVKMQHWDIQKLTQRRDEILREQSLNRVAVPELKKLVHDAAPQFGFPVLPRTIVPRGEIQAVPLDAKYLRSLEAWELKRYVKIYGPNVNKRLAGQD